jgi:hypothetical protein
LDDSKTQAERFKEAAQQIAADESPDALDRVMGKLDLKKKPEAEDQKAKLISQKTVP